MSLLNTKFINDGVPLTIEDIGVSSSFANDVAYNIRAIDFHKLFNFSVA
jgi:hypothetical protein